VGTPGESEAGPPGTGLVAVALSGGVDSALAAAVLVAAGHRVVGLTGVLYADDCETERGCCDAQTARALCASLGVEFYPVPLATEFARLVVAPFVAGYAAGLTPNPCLGCNRDIKLAALWEAARTLGATALATGHYARGGTRAGRPGLRRGRDEAKDQSYMLSLVPPEALARTLFPLGDMTKREVVAEARRRGLPFGARESQDACFVDGDVGEYLAARVPLVVGPVVDGEGRILGEHRGLPLYTIGQRMRLGGQAGRLYVLAKEAGRNALVVGPPEGFSRREFRAGGLNWVSVAAPGPGEGLECLAVVRYHGRPIPAAVVVEAGGETVRVTLAAHGQAVAPGQGAAFYDDEGWLLGGGVILG
jgi:tRNA-uridine 2-sulfurtransferase